MYCAREQGRIAATVCPGIILATDDNALFAACNACPQGQRLIASVRWAQPEEEEEGQPRTGAAAALAGVEKTVTELCMPKLITIEELAVQAEVKRYAVYDARKRARAGRPAQSGASGQVEDWLREQGYTWDDVYGVCDYDDEPAPAAPPPTMPSPLDHVATALDVLPETTAAAPAPMSDPAPQHHCVDVGKMVKASAPVTSPVESVPSPMDAPDISTPATAPVLMSASAALVLPLDRQPLDAILAELSRRLPGANLHIPL